MICVACKKEFQTNYKTKITCSPACSRERKLAKKREHSKKYYQASKVTRVNTFLRPRAKQGESNE